MIFEAVFWLALVAASRAIAKIYYRRRDVLYGPYIGVIVRKQNWHSRNRGWSAWQQPQAAMVREAAQASKLSLTHVDLGSNLNDAAYEKAFASTDWTKEDVLLVSDEPEHLSRSRTLVDLTTGVRIPTSYPFRDLVVAGGLMAYYRDLFDAFRHLAAQMAQILSGENPAEMPFRQPTNFRLSINTKAAQRIGISFPTTLLASADEVIA